VEQVAVLDRTLAQRRPLEILLAEDNLVNQRVAQQVLGKLGYCIDTAANGHEVLAALRRRRYDVVLMDVQMPELDGLEATQRIRQELPPGMQPAIFAMTAGAMQEDRQACRAAGMDGFLAKPIRLEELITVLETAASARQPQ
jgi:CheY-like chemotaxis protein